MNKNIIFGLLAFGAVALILVLTKPFTFFYSNTMPPLDTTLPQATTSPDDIADTEPSDDEVTELVRPRQEVIGQSAGGRNIIAYTFGTGDTEILLLSGIHGGYAWNTSLLGYELRDWLGSIESQLENVRVTIIPVINPDGLHLVAGTAERFSPDQVTSDATTIVSGRFNNNVVDLNRNFDCEWQRTGTWQNRAVSGGSAPFSEPEAAAIRDYVQMHRPVAAIAYYTTANGVYASTCRNGILPETIALLNTYGAAANYPRFEEFDYYEITGDMVNWLARQGIPAISVLLSDKNSTDFSRNQVGLRAVIEAYNEI